jgi:hypothetical protein
VDNSALIPSFSPVIHIFLHIDHPKNSLIQIYSSLIRITCGKFEPAKLVSKNCQKNLIHAPLTGSKKAFVEMSPKLCQIFNLSTYPQKIVDKPFFCGKLLKITPSKANF